MKKAAKIGLCVALGLAVAGGVCLGLVLLNKKESDVEVRDDALFDYSGLREEVRDLAKNREAVEDFLNLDIKTAKLSEEERKIVAKFEEVAAREDAAAELQETQAYIDVKDKIDEVVELYKNVYALYLIEQDVAVMFDGDLSADDLAKLNKSKNEYLNNLAKDLSDYRSEVKKLTAKDADFENKKKKLIEKGKTLEKKYAKVQLQDIIGKSKEEILSYFDKLDELDKYLTEKEQK